MMMMMMTTKNKAMVVVGERRGEVKARQSGENIFN